MYDMSDKTQKGPEEESAALLQRRRKTEQMSPENVATIRACGAEIKQRSFATHMRSCEKYREADTKNKTADKS